MLENIFFSNILIMLIFITVLLTLSSLVNGDGREVFPVHDDGQDMSHHYLRGTLT